MRGAITLPLSALAFAAVLAQASPAQAAKVHIRNCLSERVFVCAYNSHDNALTIAAEANGVRPGQKHTFNCTTNRCKVFMAISNEGAANYLPVAGVAAGAVSVGYAGLGASVVLSAGATTGAATVIGFPLLAGAAAFGVVAGIQALDTGARCKKIIRNAKKNNLKAKMKGSYTLSARTEGDKVYFDLADKMNSCSQ